MKSVKRSHFIWRNLLLSLIALSAAAVLNMQIAIANIFAEPLPDFTHIVEKTDASVVNIRTTATVPVRAINPSGNDPYELFRWFFGPDFQLPSPQSRGPRRSNPPNEERTVPRGVGSGFFISQDGHILTSSHVVTGATDIYVTLTDGREFKAKVIGTDDRTDVALLKIDAKNITALSMGDPKSLKKGQWVLAIGSPFGLDSTVTGGIISAIARDTGEYLPFIQTDVAVNPGNSGGPLLNMKGEVIGINSQIISRSGGFMGISLAIPIDEAIHVVEQLRENGKVTRGRIGVQISEVSNEVADAIGLRKAEGALVSSIEVNGPADAAGIQPGDVILKFNNYTISRWSDLPRVVGEAKTNIKVDVELWRKGKTVILSVEVAEQQSDQTKIHKNNLPGTIETNALGLCVSEVPTDLQHKLNIKGGVLVRAVEGSAIEADIQDGDILLNINNTDITGVNQFVSYVTKLDRTKVVGLMVRRNNQTFWAAIYPSR